MNLFKPCFDQRELDALKPIFESSWIGLGPKTEEFEQKFAQFVGANYCVGLNSCTAALDLAIKILDIGHGDEVIVPTMTFASTAHAVMYNLAIPIFADVDKDTLSIDFDDVIKKITKRTKAVIVVHYGGRPVDLYKLKLRIISVYPDQNIHIIEDCAHATGAFIRSQHVGTAGIISCFSFHAVKNLAMGDGGALVTNDVDIALKARSLRWLGINKNTWDRSELNEKYWWEYQVDDIGLKCHMNDIQAAIGLVQLEKLTSMNKIRKVLVQTYFENLFRLEKQNLITLPLDDVGIYQSSWHIFHIKCNDRNNLSKHLASKNIQTGVHYKPLHLYQCYGNIPHLPIAEKMFDQILSLPLHPTLTSDDVLTVCKEINGFYTNKLKGW